MDKLIAEALALRQSHPAAPARDVLDLVMQGRQGQHIDFGEVMPDSPFGQLVAAGFDSGMEPECWIGLLQCADERIRAGLLDIWAGEVWPKFLGAYRLNGYQPVPTPVMKRRSMPAL